MSPIAQCLNNSIKFLVVGGISEPDVIQFLVEESDGVTFLTQDTIYSNPRSITSDFKWFKEVRRS